VSSFGFLFDCVSFTVVGTMANRMMVTGIYGSRNLASISLAGE
jgi:hypothetical protein